MGVFGKSFAEISEGAKLLKTMNKDSSSVGNLFKSIRGVTNVNGTLITKDEAKSISQYYNAMKSGTSAAKAWGDNIKNCRSEVKGLAHDTRTGAVSIGEIDKAANKTSIAMKGLTTVASMAGNMLLSMGVSLAFEAAIQGIEYLITKEEKARKQAIEVGKTAKEESDNIIELYNAYKTANESYANNTGSKQQLTDATDNLLNALGIEKDKIGDLVKEYGSLDNAINQVSIDALKNNKADLVSAYAAAADEFQDAIDGWWGNNNTFALSWTHGREGDKEAQKFQDKFTQYLKKNGFFDLDSIEYFTGGGANGGTLQFKSIENLDDALNVYNDLINMRKALTDAFTVDELAESNLFKEVDSKINDLLEQYDQLGETQKALNENAARIQIAETFPDSSDLPKTIQEFEEYKNKLIEAANASGEFKGTQKEIETAISEVLYTYEQFKGFMQEPTVSENISLNKGFNFNDIKKAVNEYKNLGNELSKLSTDSPSLPLANVVKNTKENGKELAEYAQSFGTTSNELIKSYDKFQKQFNQDDILSLFPKDFKEAYNDYKQTVDEFNTLNLKDPAQTVFGNVDLNNRQVIEWTEQTIKQFEGALKSMGESVDVGEISTVFGSWGNYGEDGIPIAFTPMLQTDHGAELLDVNTVDTYIDSLLDQLKQMPEGWTNEDLLKLDAKGLEVDGKHIQGLIADIGETAEQTSKAMHFLGTDGALNKGFRDLKETGKYLGIAEDKFDKFMQDTEKAEWFDKLSTYNKGLVFDLSLRTDNLAEWSIGRITEEINQLDRVGKTTEEQMESLNAILEDTSDEGFVAGVKKDIASIDKLREAIKSVSGMSQEDRISLAMDMPQLLPYISDTELFKKKLNELYDSSKKGLDDRLQGQIDGLKETAPVAAEVLERIKTSLDNLYNTSFDFDIADEISSFNDLWTAMSESASATGLTADSMSKLKNRYSELADFKPNELFEKTANGIHLNVNALRNLEKAYDEQKRDELNNQLKSLVNQYEDLSREIDKTTDASKKAELIAQQNYLQNEIDEVSTLASQYDGLTSSYNKWQKAKSATDESKMFEDIGAGFEEVGKIIDGDEKSLGKVNTAVREFVQMFTTEDMLNADNSDVVDFFEKLKNTTYERYFKDMSGSSLLNFLNDAKEASDELGKSWVTLSDEGEWAFNFGEGGDAQLAKALTENGLPMTEEALQSILKALTEYSGADFKINLDSLYSNIESLQQLKTEAEKANDRLLDIGKTDIKFNFNTNDIDTLNKDIPKARLLLDSLRDDKGKLNLDSQDVQDAQKILETLIRERQQINDSEVKLFSIDTTELDTDIANAVDLMKQYHDHFNDLEAKIEVDADTTDVQQKLVQTAIELKALPDSVLTTLGIDTEQFNQDLDEIINTDAEVNVKANFDDTALNGVNDTISGTSEKVVNLIPNAEKVEEESAKEDGGQRTVEYNADTTGLQSTQSSTYGGTRTVVYKPDTTLIDETSTRLALNPITIPVNYSKSGTGQVDGTAWAYGSLGGVAFKTGNWGTKESGYALGGELGEEIVVRNGRFFTVGSDGAEFFKYEKNDVIFNAEQSKMLLEQGKITHGKRRGKALANGTVSGDAFSRGKGTIEIIDAVWGSSTSSSNSDSSSSSVADDIDKANEEAKEFEETIDWIEIKISRIEQVISDLSKTSENVYKKWADRNDALRKDISKTTEEIDIQKKAYDRYIQEANSVGLDSNVAKDVHEGKIDITKITDEDLSKQIKEFQTYYEKALAAKYAINDLEGSVSKLYATAFDNVQTRFDSVFAVLENTKNEVNEYISQTENQGYFVSTKLYETLGKREKNTITQLQKEREELIKAMNTAVNTGAIKKGSEEWNRMAQEIANVTLEIEKSHTKLTEYAKTIREIKWDIFDTIEKRISNITTETDFLINLLSNSKLFNNKGAFSYEGMATVGLHAVDYNTYMAQADTYAEEVQRLDREINGTREDYERMVEEFNSLELEDPTQTVFGNIDLNNRKVLEWTEENLDKYKDVIEAWGESVEDMGDYSTVFGMWDDFENLQIAFSPMLQTPTGAQLLSPDTVYEYINTLLSKLRDKGEWTTEDLLKFDARGLTIDGMRINKLIADIGETAEQTSMAMHYLGTDGALARAAKQIEIGDKDNKVKIERRDELLKLQQENILAAEKEKQAMKSLVEEGIKIELDNLKDLIDKKKDALDSEKDLYEYRKKTKEQTKEIADLEKQMAAYANDNSEETRTTVQKLKVSLADAKENLEETQYDKYISDTKAVLDQFYNDYETVINKRLDNIDRLIREMIQSTNSQSGEIASTIYNYSDRVGYAMSESNEQIWGNAYKSIQDESNQRFEQMKTTVDGLIANGFISQADGQEIMDLLGKGDVTNINSVVEGIHELLFEGKISTGIADELRGNLITKTDVGDAIKSLNFVSSLESDGILTNKKADEIRNAILDDKSGISAGVGASISELLKNNQIDFNQGSLLLNAINAGSTGDVVSGLKSIEELYKSGLLTESEKSVLIDGIVTGDSINSQGIITRLWMNEQADQKSLSGIINAFGGTNGNLGQIQLALSSVKDAYIKGKLTQEEAEKIFGSIINGDGSALKGMSQKLVDAFGEDTLKDVISAITGEKSEQIQKAFDTINYLEKENELDSEWKRDTIDALLSGDKTALNKSIETLKIAVESGQTHGNNISSLLSLLSRSVERPINVASPEINASSLMPVVSTYSEEFKNALVGVVGKDSVLIHAITTVTDAINKITISTSERRIGDVNGGDGDGLVDVRDAAYIAAMLAIGKKDNVDSYYGDMDQDKKISVRDAARIARTLAERGYAKGIKKISENQFAWTQEDGEEYIIRPSDGAILTPLARNDSVITASASNNIWNMANDPEKFIKDNIRIGSSNIPNNTTQSTVSYNSGDMQIVLPNVQNYQDFKYALQHDKNFEGFIRSITVDKLFGKSSLRKYKM